MGNAEMLKNKLEFAAFIQGSKKDPITGEQPGAIFHEYDIALNNGVELKQRPGFTTFYNASDTTALFLWGHEKYQEWTNDTRLARKYFGNIARAADYILNHLNKNSVFVEDPKFSDAEYYALKVTYWKDSVLFDRKGGEPSYPIVYPLVHIQNLAGLRSAAKILQSAYLYQKAEKMKKSLFTLYNKKIMNFPIAIDKIGEIAAVSSDGLNALFYLDPGDLPFNVLEDIIRSSEVLETKMGYRTLEPKAASKVANSYHARTVWTHEQAQIHMGASKHLKEAHKNKNEKLIKLLERVREVSFRVNSYLDANPKSFPELFVVEENDKIVPGGCDPQLWAVAASEYFKRATKN
jgi:glycogen debranching enzyme